MPDAVRPSVISRSRCFVAGAGAARLIACRHCELWNGLAELGGLLRLVGRDRGVAGVGAMVLFLRVTSVAELMEDELGRS